MSNAESILATATAVIGLYAQGLLSYDEARRAIQSVLPGAFVPTNECS